MRPQRTTSRRPEQTRYGRTTKPKRNNAPTAVRRRNSSVADLQEQIAFLARELTETRDQQFLAAVIGVGNNRAWPE
jgi:hypothetical protein